jgi:spore photoproduct lyase
LPVTFEFFKKHPIAKATLATKIIPINFLSFNPKQKVRIRFSLMPQHISSILEPNTPDIIDRIKAVDAFIDDAFIESGYDVHLNFSPVIVYDGWLDDYEMLFNMVNDYIDNKEFVKAEVIFLTHNENKHVYNLKNNIQGEEYMYRPDIQEAKTSQYGGENIRYKSFYKKELINQFTNFHDKIMPWNKIRYIF